MPGFGVLAVLLLAGVFWTTYRILTSLTFDDVDDLADLGRHEGEQHID